MTFEKCCIGIVLKMNKAKNESSFENYIRNQTFHSTFKKSLPKIRPLNVSIFSSFCQLKIATNIWMHFKLQNKAIS